MQVIKRDGREVEFNKQRIREALFNAFQDVDGELTESASRKASEIANHIEKLDKESMSVEEIQNIVEEKLMASNRKDVARAYILYRDKRNRVRQYNTKLMKDYKEKIEASNVVNQNANVDEHSFGGRIGEAGSMVLKDYALNNCMSEMARNNHLNNEVYIHDLDSYAVGMHNCLSVPFDDLLANGFKTRQTDVRPANSVNTAMQLVAVIFQIQSLQQFGGVSATHLDWTMVPYVRKSFYKHFKDGLIYISQWNETAAEGFRLECVEEDRCIDDDKYFKQVGINSATYKYAMDMTEKELHQAVEGLMHNLNTLQSRSGCQLPFTSINYGTCTLPEGRMVTKALLEGSINGVGKLHKTPIFPCGIFQSMKGVNQKEGDPNYDLFQLALESTAKRLYPNYANVDWSGNAGYDINDPKTYFSTMGCRTANGMDINAELGTNPQTKDGRGNICPVTIILPTLAMEVKKTGEESGFINGENGQEVLIDAFMDLLDDKIHEAKDMLIERFEWICNQSPESAKFMYENNTMLGYKPEEGIRSALKHGTIVVGC